MYRTFSLAALSGLLALAIITIIVVLLSSFLLPAEEAWNHILSSSLQRLTVNTIYLALFTGAGTLLIGVPLAWLTAACQYPGQKFFSRALMLPLALPAYVTGFIYIGIFEYSGPVHGLAEFLSLREYVPMIRGRAGLTLVMSLSLYPYVYLLSRNAFLTGGIRSIEAARSLGLGPYSSFFKLTLPMSRPWILGGLLLVLMETLADFGTVSIYQYDTFTTEIYRAWYGFFSLSTASRLSVFLLVAVSILFSIEYLMNRRRRYLMAGSSHLQFKRIELKGTAAISATFFSFLILFAGFILPVTQLMIWAFHSIISDLEIRYLYFTMQSIFIASAAAMITLVAALILARTRRSFPGIIFAIITRVATTGYALPGSVLAVGVFLPLIAIDRFFADLFAEIFSVETTFLLTGTFIGMLIALSIRFMAVAYNTVSSAMQRIPPEMDEVSASLNVTGWQKLRRVYIPLLKGGLFSAFLLVFVDVMKEMPITLMLRPFGWTPLSVRIYEMTAEGMWDRAALPALVLLMVGLIPVALLSSSSDNYGKKDAGEDHLNIGPETQADKGEI